MDTAKLINTYHNLVKNEYENIVDEKSKVINPEHIDYSMDYEYIVKTFGEDVFENLRKMGFLVKLDEDNYRTLHIDVAIRSAYIRTQYDGVEYIVGPRLELYELPIPSKEDRTLKPLGSSSYEREFYRRVKGFFDDTEIANIYCQIIKEYLENSGFDIFQMYSLITLLKENDILNKKNYIITAPTGAGKTEIFLLYALAKLLKNKINGDNGKVLLTYPRKALAIDQSSRVIKLLFIANKILESCEIGQITFGIRDGDTKRNNQIKDGDLFRGMVCPICGKDVKLKYFKSGKRCIIKCENNHEFEFIKATKDDMGKEPPDFLISNMWAIEWRLIEQKNNKNDINVSFFENVSLLVVDEAHEYTGLGGGLVSILLKLIKDLTNMPDFEIILSSATLPSPKNFAKKLTGIDEVYHIDFNTMINRDKIEFKGKRLVLMGIYDISPQHSWTTYARLWAIMMSFLHYVYEKQNKSYPPQSLIFIQNIKEIRRALSGFKENVAIGEPRDHISDNIDPYDPYSFLPYIEDEKLLEEIREKLNSGDKLDELLDLTDEMHSDLNPEKRFKIMKKLKSQKGLGVVFSTSTLELGVDYGGVSFILNAGFENPLSLRQRIGRGGRTESTLRTTLGIILTRKLPSESFLIYDANIWDKLNPMGSKDEDELIISHNNPQVNLRRNLTKGLIKLAQSGKNTYVSGQGIRSDDELKEFLYNWLDKL